jgi:hypothetical protein
MQAAGDFSSPDLQELMRSLARIVLHEAIPRDGE